MRRTRSHITNLSGLKVCTTKLINFSMWLDKQLRQLEDDNLPARDPPGPLIKEYTHMVWSNELQKYVPKQ